MRMDLPCRSTVCSHNQCFDAMCFIQLQEQAPTWTCPICSKVVSYEALAVDQYVLDILQRTAKSIEQVVLEPEGAWKEISDDAASQRDKSQPRAAYDDDDDDDSDDDLVEISGPNGGVPIKKDSSQPGSAGLGAGQHMTPPLSSRETSVAQGARGPRSKRPSAVIDLTLSDDDEPPRPAKRQQSQATNTTSISTPSSMPDPRGQDWAQRRFNTPYNGFAQALHSPQPSTHDMSPRPPDLHNQRLTSWANNYTGQGNGWNGQYSGQSR